MLRKARLFRRGTPEEKLYHVWYNMLDRCKKKEHPAYHRYGGRGIKVCREWHDFVTFREWAVVDYQEGLWLDRENNDGDYEPNNCRWIKPAESRDNVSGTRRITAFSETKTVSQWAKDARCKVRHDTLAMRVFKYRLDPETSIITPAGFIK